MVETMFEYITGWGPGQTPCIHAQKPAEQETTGQLLVPEVLEKKLILYHSSQVWKIPPLKMDKQQNEERKT